MKKSDLLMILFLGIIMLPFVSASITIDNTFNPKYNLGEHIDIKGTITETSDISGILNIAMECSATATEYRTVTVNETVEVEENETEKVPCFHDSECAGEEVCWENFCKDFNKKTETITKTITEPVTTGETQSIQLAAKSLRLKKDVSGEFSYSLPVTGALLGNCAFKLTFNDLASNTLADQATSNSFEITKELKGSFNINKQEFQLGDDISISGTVLNLRDLNVNGIAVIYIKKDNVNYIVDTVLISGGAFSYKTKLLALPAGSYAINIEASDMNGNRYLFENALLFTLYNDLIISALSDKESYLPESIVKITGAVQKKLGGYISGVKININFDNQNYTTDINNGQFSFNIPLSKNVKSYYHNISFDTEDQNANYGMSITRIDVIPIPTLLTLDLDKQTYQPKQAIIVKPILYDQANDTLQRMVDIEIKNPKNDIVFTYSAVTGDEVKYELPDFAFPGPWRVNIKSEDLKAAKDANVEIVKVIDVLLSGQVLSLANLGNEKFEDDVSIEAASEGSEDTKSVVKKFYLKPNQTKSIELNKIFNPGTYSITVLDKTFDSVTIIDERNILEKLGDGIADLTGYTVLSESKDMRQMGFTSLIIIILIIALFLSLKYKGKFKFNFKKPKAEKNFDLTQKGVPIKTENIGVIPVQRKTVRSVYGRANADDIADFKRRMRYNFERERRFGRPSNEKSGGGPFSMFD